MAEGAIINQWTIGTYGGETAIFRNSKAIMHQKLLALELAHLQCKDNVVGSRIGSFKTAAAKIGILPADYTQMRLEGNKWCAGCKTWLPANWFYHLCGRCVPCNRQHNRNLRAKAIDTKI